MSFRSGASKPGRVLKKGIDSEESRRRREEVTIELRKNKREENLQKRRQMAGGVIAHDEMSMGVTPGQLPASNEAKMLELQQKLLQLPQLIAAVMTDDPAAQVEAVTSFRKLLSIERNPPIQQVIDAGVVPRLVSFLSNHNNPVLQFESAWALTNIASGTSKHTLVVIEYGAIPVFVHLLKSPHQDVREQAVWALGNIAGDSAECRDLVLRAGALQPLLDLCTQGAKISMLRNATWTLSNFCRGKPQPDFNLVSPALPVLAQLLHVKDDEVLTDACWALSYLSDDTGTHNQKIQAVIQTGVARQLVQLLMHPSPNVKTPALRTVGNIVTGDDVQTQAIMNFNVLPSLLSLLINPKKGIRKEACWTISNITAGNPDQIEAVINANLIPPLVNILSNSEFDIQKEAAWAISNATSGGREEQIRYLVSQGVIPPLCTLFTCPDVKIVMVAMEGIENILRVGALDAKSNPNGTNFFADIVDECGGLDELERLQHHENEDIYDKAVKIIKTYWDNEEGESGTQPQVAEGHSQFQFGVPQQQQGGFSFGS